MKKQSKILKLSELVRTDGLPVTFRDLSRGVKNARKMLYWNSDSKPKWWKVKSKELKKLRALTRIEKVFYFEKLNEIVIYGGSYLPSDEGYTFKTKLGNVIYLGEL